MRFLFWKPQPKSWLIVKVTDGGFGKPCKRPLYDQLYTQREAAKKAREMTRHQGSSGLVQIYWEAREIYPSEWPKVAEEKEKWIDL